MADIVEVDDNGRIELPRRFLRRIKARARLEVQIEGNALRVVPVEESEKQGVEELQAQAHRLWSEASSEERVKAFREWLEMPRPKSPLLPDEAMHRESMYD